MYIADERANKILEDTINRVRSMKGGPGIRVLNASTGITISLDDGGNNLSLPSPQLSITLLLVGSTSISSPTTVLAGAVYAACMLDNSTCNFSMNLTVGSTLPVSAFGGAGSSNCYFVNEPERGLATHTALANGTGVGTISAVRLIGAASDGYPVFGGSYTVPTPQDFKMVIVKGNGGSGGSSTFAGSFAYDLYNKSDSSYTTKLNLSGALQPTCGRARTIIAPIAAAADGSLAQAGFNASNIIILWDCQETYSQQNCTT